VSDPDQKAAVRPFSHRNLRASPMPLRASAPHPGKKSRYAPPARTVGKACSRTAKRRCSMGASPNGTRQHDALASATAAPAGTVTSPGYMGLRVKRYGPSRTRKAAGANERIAVPCRRNHPTEQNNSSSPLVRIGTAARVQGWFQSWGPGNQRCRNHAPSAAATRGNVPRAIHRRDTAARSVRPFLGLICRRGRLQLRPSPWPGGSRAP